MDANNAEERARRGRILFILAMLLLSLALLSDPAKPRKDAQTDDKEAEDLNTFEEGYQSTFTVQSPYVFPSNLSHNFRGDWMLNPDRIRGPRSENVSIVPNLVPIRESRLMFQHLEGSLVIQLRSFRSNEHGIHLLVGSYHIADGDSSTNRDLMGTLQGVYLESAGILGFGTTGSMSGLKILWNNVTGASERQDWTDGNGTVTEDATVRTTGYNRDLRTIEQELSFSPVDALPAQGPGVVDTIRDVFASWGPVRHMKSVFAHHTPQHVVGPRVDWTVDYDTIDSTRCVLWAEMQVAPVGRAAPSTSALLNPANETDSKDRDLEAPDQAPGTGLLDIVSDSEANREFRRRNPKVTPPVLLPVVGVAHSANCKFTLNITAVALVVDRELVEEKAMQYSMMMTACIVLQMVALIKQLTSTSTTSAAGRMSLLTVGMQAVMDSYICLLHVVAGIMWETLFNSFATISFSELMLFSILEMRLMLHIWKARRAEAFANGWNETRRQLGILYARFYGALIVGMFLMYQFWAALPVFLVLGYSFWVPQIIHSAHQDTHDGLTAAYLIISSVTRLMLPLYFLGYPYSFLQYLQPTEPNYPLCVTLVAWMALQIVVILCQRKFGPRFFIPARFLPEKYDYYRPVIVTAGRIEPDPNPGARSSRGGRGGTPSPCTACARMATWARAAANDICFRIRFWRATADIRGAFAAVRPDDDDSDATASISGDTDVSASAMNSRVIRRQSANLNNAAVVTADDEDAPTTDVEAGGDDANSLGAIDCVICMTEVAVSDRSYMVTPCAHLFHESCLQQWMDVKMECPTCRAVLPAP